MRRVLIALGLLLLWSIPGLLSSSATLILFPTSPTIGGNVQRFLLVAVMQWWVWVPLTPAIIALAQRFPLERGHVARRLSLHISAAIVCGFLYVVSAGAVTWGWQRVFPPSAPAVPPGAIVTRMTTPPRESLWQYSRGLIASRLPIGLIIYATGAGIGMAMHERRRRRARESHALKLEADLAHAELRALQMQLQPHFLFNTLHAISVLIDENPRAASAMISQLGDLLRETLRMSGTSEVTLRKELELLRQYLAIEEVRLGERLVVSVNAPDSLLDLSVPMFLLQPLVENAVRHGIATRMEPGRINISAERWGPRLRMTVADDGPGFGAMREDGIGLRATRDRLALRYRDRATLTQANGTNGGAVVTVEIPIGDV